jgi:uncharacterized membrane protein SirB2
LNDRAGLPVTSGYAAVKLVHIGTAALSIALFALRGAWMISAPQRLLRRWVQIAPHVIDTVLLASALWLAWAMGAAGTRGWLWAKGAALFAYIALGTIALKRGRTRGVRIAAFAAALVTFGYIVAVAIAKSPLPWVASL